MRISNAEQDDSHVQLQKRIESAIADNAERQRRMASMGLCLGKDWTRGD